MTDAEAEGRLMHDPDTGELLKHPETGELLYAYHRRHLLLRSRNQPEKLPVDWRVSGAYVDDDLGTRSSIYFEGEDALILPPENSEPLGLRFKSRTSVSLIAGPLIGSANNVNGLFLCGFVDGDLDRPWRGEWLPQLYTGGLNTLNPIDHSRSINFFADYGLDRLHKVRATAAAYSSVSFATAHVAAKSAIRAMSITTSSSTGGGSVRSRDRTVYGGDYGVEITVGLSRYTIPEHLQGRKLTAWEIREASTPYEEFTVSAPGIALCKVWSHSDSVSGGVATVQGLESLSVHTFSPAHGQVLVSIDPPITLGAYLWVACYHDNLEIDYYRTGWNFAGPGVRYSVGNREDISFDLEPEE